MNVATFTRVSTDQQTVDNQALDIERLVKHRGWSVVATYREEGVSGAAQRRPSWSAC